MLILASDFDDVDLPERTMRLISCIKSNLL